MTLSKLPLPGPAGSGSDVSGSSAAGVAEEGLGEGERVLMGEGRGHRHLDAADADADQGTDFQQLQANGAAGGLGELGMGNAEVAHGAEEHVGPSRPTTAAIDWPASDFADVRSAHGSGPQGRRGTSAD